MGMFSRLRQALGKRRRLDTYDNCIIAESNNTRHLFCTLGTPIRDDAVALISTALELFGEDDTTLEFASIPSEQYRKFLAGLKTSRDTYLNRARYLQQASQYELDMEWERAGRAETDVAMMVLFSVQMPPLETLGVNEEYTTHYRLTKQAQKTISLVLQWLYQDAKIYVSREVIHWGDYIQNPDRYFENGVAALNGQGGYYFGMDLEQRFGQPADARYMAPLLCLPVVVRRPMTRVMTAADGMGFLRTCLPAFGEQDISAISGSLEESGIEPVCIYNMLMPPAYMEQEVEKVLAEKGVTFSVVQ